MKHYFALLLTVLTILASCSYDEHTDTYNIEVRLSESVADVSVKMTNNIGSTFEASQTATVLPASLCPLAYTASAHRR